MEELILFILTYIFVFVIYQIFIVSPAKKRKKNNVKTDKELFEVKYLVSKYKLDLDMQKVYEMIAVKEAIKLLNKVNYHYSLFAEYRLK